MTEPETPEQDEAALVRPGEHPALTAEVDPAELPAHEEYLAALRADTAGKPPHAAYLEALLDTPLGAHGDPGPPPPRPRGCSASIADALDDDVWTARQHSWPANGHVEHRYRDLRLRRAQRAAEQAAHRRSRNPEPITLGAIGSAS